MRKIPAGKTISYSELAKWAGSPDAVRAAGTACANNLIALIVPCHRIIKSNGEIGNYGYGVKIKKLLLTHEGAL
jgi:methylated-DNA-[protein]-cysteine S-methyltransferase